MAAPKKRPEDKASCNHSYKLTPGESEELDKVCHKYGVSKSNLVRWFLPFCNGDVFRRKYPKRKGGDAE